MVDVNEFLDYFNLMRDITNNLPPATEAPGIIGRANREMCNIYGRTPSGIAAGDGWLTATMNSLCGDYLRGQGGDLPQVVQQFTGGQCPNLRYVVRATVRFTVTNLNTNESSAGQGDIESAPQPGPIGNLSFAIEPIPINSQRIVVNATSNGNPFNVGIIPLQNDRSASGVSINNVTVSEAFGRPDVCGDPPPIEVPGIPGTGPNWGDPIVIPGPTGRPITINIDKPTVGPTGDVNIPLTINNDVQINLGASSEGGPAPSVPPIEEQPAIPGDDLGQGDGEFPPPPDGQEYIGVIVRVTSEPVREGKIVTALPTRIYPRTVGNAALKLQTNTGTNFRPVNHQIREGEFTLLRPYEGLNVRGVDVKFDPSFQFEVIPLTVSTPEGEQA